jgi:patatin-like phospholipase/acyl hydrolase
MGTGTANNGCFKILSLDGGGLKGVFTASLLTEWETHAAKPIHKQFDLIAGTSTGGIIALALGAGISAREILELYTAEASTIFPEKSFGNLKHWTRVKHSAEGLERVLAKYLGDRTLGESLTRLVIPAFYAKRQEIYLFKTPHHERLRYDYKEKLTDVARATAAAPTYLDPFTKESGLQLIDGGMFANNPVMIAVAEALGYLQVPQTSIKAARIGTTTEVRPMDEYSDSGGKLAMAGPVVDYMMAGQELSASGMVRHILGAARFHEINPVAAPGDFVLDKLSTSLVGLGEHEFRKHCSDLADKGFFTEKTHNYKPYYS